MWFDEVCWPVGLPNVIYIYIDMHILCVCTYPAFVAIFC